MFRIDAPLSKRMAMLRWCPSLVTVAMTGISTAFDTARRLRSEIGAFKTYAHRTLRFGESFAKDTVRMPFVVPPPTPQKRAGM